MKKTFLPLILIFLFLISCTYNVEEITSVKEDDCSPSISFNNDVKNIITTHCLECHSGNQFPDLRSFKNIITNKEKIKEQVASRNMPLSGSLTNEQIKKIICWIDNGAPNN